MSRHASLILFFFFLFTMSHSTSSSDLQNDGVSSSPTTSSKTSELLNFLWMIPFFSSLSKSSSQPAILLPSQLTLHSHNSKPKSCPASDPKLNFRPVIGILSHPGDGASGRLNSAANASYIAASYVKFVESAGARVIPLIYNEPHEILFNVRKRGWAKSGVYYETGKKIFKFVLEKNDGGDHYPLYAICLGFELLTMIIGEDTNILESFNATDQASTLQFMRDTNIEGTVFQRFPPHLLKKLSTDCLVMQNHKYGISPERLQENKNLSSFFKLLTTSVDADNQVYVSTVQAHDYPVTVFQWHPEKNAFEWGLSTIPHSEDAIHVTQLAANYFVSEARKSLNRPLTRQVLDNLIYNYRTTYCGKAGKGYDEVYIFSKL